MAEVVKLGVVTLHRLSRTLGGPKGHIELGPDAFAVLDALALRVNTAVPLETLRGKMMPATLAQYRNEPDRAVRSVIGELRTLVHALGGRAVKFAEVPATGGFVLTVPGRGAASAA